MGRIVEYFLREQFSCEFRLMSWLQEPESVEGSEVLEALGCDGSDEDLHE